MAGLTDTVGVLCVEDNPQVAEALRIKFNAESGYLWRGWLPNADRLVETTKRLCPSIVLLDLDMPGRNPFEALAELSRLCPDSRVVILSGHVRRDFIERALESGAWGYVSKNDNEDEILRAIERVVRGEIAFSPEAAQIYNQAE